MPMLFPALRTALFLAAVSCFGSSPLVSQTQPQPQSQPGGATPTTDLHRRVVKLEREQESTVGAPHPSRPTTPLHLPRTFFTPLPTTTTPHTALPPHPPPRPA